MRETKMTQEKQGYHIKLYIGADGGALFHTVIEAPVTYAIS